jgi:uncharacterized protein with GYD domain
MVKGVILVDYTDQGRRTIKDSPDRAEASKQRQQNFVSRSESFFTRPVDSTMQQS